MKAMLALSGVASGYGRTRVLRDIEMQVHPGEIVALVGANGAGKSTLLGTIMGSVTASAGTVNFKDADITRLKTPAIVARGIAQVPERRQLFGTMTVEENLLLGAYTRTDADGVRADIEKHYEQFPVLKERRRQLAGTLSGGEQQMLAIARALMSRPKLLLNDEPSLGLAPLMVARIFEQIAQLRDAGVTVLLVEQNARVALEIADRAYVLESGRITLSGPARELLENSRIQDAYLGGHGSMSRAMEMRLRAKAKEISGAESEKDGSGLPVTARIAERMSV
jgi:branched-chain amino acid transport system ATP-binding protein